MKILSGVSFLRNARMIHLHDHGLPDLQGEDILIGVRKYSATRDCGARLYDGSAKEIQHSLKPLLWALLRSFLTHGTQKPPVSSIGGSQKGGFQKGGFGGCSPGTKTGTRVRSPKPPFYETALLSPSDSIAVPCASHGCSMGKLGSGAGGASKPLIPRFPRLKIPVAAQFF